MSVTTVLFDLDGTLLPMEQEVFLKAYLGGLCKKLAPLGYDPKAVVDGIWAGTGAMVKNDGSRLNEEAFWKEFCRIFGEKARQDLPVFFMCSAIGGLFAYSPRMNFLSLSSSALTISFSSKPCAVRKAAASSKTPTALGSCASELTMIIVPYFAQRSSISA